VRHTPLRRAVEAPTAGWGSCLRRSPVTTILVVRPCLGRGLDFLTMLRCATRSFRPLFRTGLQAGLSLALGCALLSGCDEPPPGDSDTSEETGDDTGEDSGESGEEVVGFLDVGFGETDFTPIVDGGELRVVWGAQGSAMIPLPIRAGGITVPDDPRDYTDERAPLLDVTLDVDGEDAGFCGHFKCVSNYPMSFDVLSDGTYEFMYVRMIMPDGVDVQSLDGKTATLRVELSPIDSGTLIEEFELTLLAEPPPI